MTTLAVRSSRGGIVSILNDDSDPRDKVEERPQQAANSTNGPTVRPPGDCVPLVQRPTPSAHSQLALQQPYHLQAPQPHSQQAAQSYYQQVAPPHSQQQVGRSQSLSQSPLSPFVDHHFSGANSASLGPLPPRPDEYMAVDGSSYADGPRRQSLFSNTGSSSFDEDGPATGGKPASSAKRFPCRYRDSHDCNKTFTTSGHASRHSKIHTAEKAVPCTFPGCPKKFTRADNMKQHLETHNKNKTRAYSPRRSTPRRSSRSSPSPEKSSSSSSKSRVDSVTSSQGQTDSTTQTPPSQPSPVDSWGPLSEAISRRPSASATRSSGLDALAMAVAYQKEHQKDR